MNSKVISLIFLVIMLFSFNSKKLIVLANLDKDLDEVSGIETIKGSELIWMLNDSGNKPFLFGVTKHGEIKKEIKINAENNDWEDLTSDKKGNLYIGDFGNNYNQRKNLAILKVNSNSLKSDKKIDIERISFRYPNQSKFPPKKNNMYFDCEAIFHHNDSLFLFTKSRVKGDFGKTNLYKIPAKKGNHIAEFISSFNSGSEQSCWITGADISENGKKVVLLTSKSVWMFTDFTNTNFFNGNTREYTLNHNSQKEGICFKNNNTLYITDEKAHGFEGDLYEYKLH